MLQNLIIEADGTMAATTGHTIAAWRHAVTPAPGHRVLLELIDKDAQTMIARLAKRAAKDEPLFGVTLAPSGKTITLSFGNESLTITPRVYAADYPDWRQTFRSMAADPSRKAPASLLSLNLSYLNRFIGSPQLQLGDARDAVIVSYSHEPSFWGAIMPIGFEVVANPFPSWCAEDQFDRREDDFGENDSPEKGSATVSVNGGPRIDMAELVSELVGKAVRP